MVACNFFAAFVAASALSGDVTYQTPNFVVTAANAELAREIGDTAETLRRSLALDWLGHELPPWQEPCAVTAKVDTQVVAGAATSYSFDGRRLAGCQMNVQGGRGLILETVLPHEVLRLVLGTYFGRPIPRWIEEGAGMLAEHPSRRAEAQRLLIEVLTSTRGIPFNRMFAMMDYPLDILALYSQGYSLARYLIESHGKREFVQYVGDGLDSNDWAETTRTHYGFQTLPELQDAWLEWVCCGSQPLSPRAAPADQVSPPNALPEDQQIRTVAPSADGKRDGAVPTVPGPPPVGRCGAWVTFEAIRGRSGK